MRAALFLIAFTLAKAEQLPPWTEGMLDIHHISTGRGNSTLFVLPDGTTMLVDAGAAGDGIPETDPHPDGTRTPGAWIARYLKRHQVTALDYAVITHFHPDHMGAYSKSAPPAANETYRLTGITEVGTEIPIRVLLDRASPEYFYPVPLNDDMMTNYARFIAAQRHMKATRFRPGSSQQIVLNKGTAKYPQFEIRNIVANGEVWTGSGDSTRYLFPPTTNLRNEDYPTENMCSLGFRLQYGAFRYFTGGDLPGTADPGFPAWHALEAAIAQAIGKVDVHVVNQHGSMGEESDEFLKVLQSSVLIVPSWAPSHPAPDVLKRIMNSRYPPSSRLVYVTDLRPSAKTVIGQRAKQLAGPPGHIVVRVEPGGARYRVYVLDHSDERDSVLAVSPRLFSESR